MKTSLLAATLAAPLAIAGCGAKEQGAKRPEPKPVVVRGGIGHAAWGNLLAKYVDGRGLVDYAAWKTASPDRETLRRYLAEFAAAPRPPARGDDLAASLINAYNASTVSWILDAYPTESIRSLPHSFDGQRHAVGGRMVSLDEIEHGTLRPALGFRIHATLVCAARSCPPLAREAYRAENLDAQLDGAMRRWLSREDLNSFLPAENRAEISMIFRWYPEDFEKAKGGLRGVLALFAPPAHRRFLEGEGYKIDYKTYDWGLNDQGSHGRSYGGVRELLDKVRNP